jgi:hypothetical protein
LEIAPGTNIKCPRCNVVFVMPESKARGSRVVRARHAHDADPDDFGPPRRRQRPARREDHADDFEEEDLNDRLDRDEGYALPRRRSVRGHRGSHQGLLIGLIIGGSVAFLAVIGLVLFLVLRSSSSQTDKPIVGAWQPINQPGFTRAEFTADGKLHVTFSNRPAATGTYRFLDANTIEIEEPGPFGNTIKTQATVAINGDDMTVTNNVLGTSVQYRRIR